MCTSRLDILVSTLYCLHRYRKSRCRNRSIQSICDAWIFKCIPSGTPATGHLGTQAVHLRVTHLVIPLLFGVVVNLVGSHSAEYLLSPMKITAFSLTFSGCRRSRFLLLLFSSSSCASKPFEGWFQFCLNPLYLPERNTDYAAREPCRSFCSYNDFSAVLSSSLFRTTVRPLSVIKLQPPLRLLARIRVWLAMRHFDLQF